MKNAKKILALLLCAVLLVGASVAGTLAYLTDKHDVTNTFTVGKVDIKLTENGQEAGLNLHLVPNVPVDKEPVVTVLKDSEDCYVRVKVTVDVSDSWTPEAAKAAGWMSEGQEFAEAFNNWATRFAENYLITGSEKGFNRTNWEVSGPDVASNAKTVTYILYYKDNAGSKIVPKSTSDTELPAVFEQVVAPAKLTNDQLALLAGMTIKVEAHAIQAGSFNGDATAAWTAFDNP